MALVRDRVSLAKAGRLEDTPQGYLWCRDVPLARTGTMEYAPFEVPAIPPVSGQRSIVVDRTADEVFSPDAIASFRGMPLTDDHPDNFVFAHNHREHAIGEIHDPRRGEGEHADCLVADILVKDAEAIGLIKSRRKREISCGYDADYTDIRPGYGRQINIRGNHVSLVDAGRAGPRIAIRDRLMSKPSARRRAGIADTLRGLFVAKTDQEREPHIRALDEAMAGEGDGGVVNVHVHAPDKDEPPKPGEGENPAPEEGKGMDEDKIKEICGSVVGEAIDAKLAPVMTAIQALAEKFDATAAKADEAGQKADAVAEAVEEMADPDDMEMQDAVARAEVLAPGVTVPARDAKPGTKAARDAVSSFKRETLKRAATTDSGRAVLAALGYAQPHQIATLPPQAVDTVFRCASQMMADRNAQISASTLVSATTGYVRDDNGSKRPMTVADLQANADKFFKRSA